MRLTNSCKKRFVVSALVVCLLSAMSVRSAGEVPVDALSAECGSCRMYFDRATGGLCGIYSKVTQNWLVSPGDPRGVFALALKRPGMGAEAQPQRIEAGEAKLQEQSLDGNGTLRQRYLLPDSRSTVAVQVEFGESSPYSIWRISLENHTGKDIYEVDFPVISDVSSMAGGELSFRGGGYRVQEAPFQYASLCDPFPSRIPFPVLDIYSAKGEGGFYLMDLDEGRQRTEICTFGAKRTAMLAKTIRIPDGTCYRQPSRALLGAHRGDWHTAGIIYRDFLKEHGHHVQQPEWFENCHGYYQQGWGPRPRFSDIAYWAEVMKEESGLNFIFYANLDLRWGHAVRAPHLGELEDFRGAIRKMRRNKLYFMSYYLANSMHPMSDPAFLEPCPDKIGVFKLSSIDRRFMMEPGLCTNGALKNLDGNGIYEWTPLKGPFDFSLAGRERMFNSPGCLRVCLELPGIHRHFMNVTRLLASTGQDGFYWDTVGCGNHVCFDSSHGHGYGGYAEGESQWLKKCWEIARSVNPDAVFMNESINVCSGTCQSFCSGTHPIFAAVRFISPENIGFVGNGNHPKDTLGAYLESFRCGMRLGGFNAWWDSEAERRNQRQYPGLLALRKQIFEFLYPAHFQDTLGTERSDPGLSVGLFNAPFALANLVTVTNRQKRKDARVVITAPEVQNARYAYVVQHPHARFSRQPFTKTAGELAFTAPDELASAVLFLDGPTISLRADGENLGPGGTATVTVTVRNLSPDSAEGTVALELPHGWPRVSPQSFHLADELEMAELRFRVQAPAEARTGRHDIHAVSTSGGRTVRRWAMLYVEEPVRVDVEQRHLDWCCATLRNMTGSSREVFLDIQSREPSAFTGYMRKMELQPGETRQVDFRIPGLADAQQPFRVNVRCSSNTPPWREEFVETFWPLVANGDLELDNFTDVLPDYWWVANPERSPLLKAPWYHWTKDGGYGDNGRALMLDGGEGHQYSLSSVGPLRPGQSYRLSARIKATDGQGVSVVCVGVMQSGDRNASLTHLATREDGQRFTAELRPSGKVDAQGWEECTAVFTVPEHLKIFASYKGFANIYFNNPTPGSRAWFDNVRLVPYQP